MWVWQIPKDKAERLEPSGVIFRDLIDLKKILNLYMSWRRLQDLSVAAKDTSIVFNMREIQKFESDCFSVS